MKKNIIKLFAILAMCFVIGGVLVACGQGEKGDKGDKGDQGVAGLTPYIGSNGNWWVGETDTGVKAEGKDGQDGKDGVDATDCEDHDWSKTYALCECSGTAEAHQGATVLVICANCGDADLVIADHVVTDAVTAATCTTPELTAFVCPTCNDTWIKETAPALGHVAKVEFDKDNIDTTVWERDLTVVADCLCTEVPVYHADCDRCGEEHALVGEGEPQGHVWGEYTHSINKTGMSPCEWREMDVAECQVCDCHSDKVYTSEAVDHRWGEWTIVTAPTKDAEGVAVRECSECADEYASGTQTVVLPKLNDTDYVYAQTKAPNCVDAGSGNWTYTYTYLNANEDETTSEITVAVEEAAKGHNYVGATYVINKSDLPKVPVIDVNTMTDEEIEAAIAAATGVAHVDCVDCDHVQEVEIPALTVATGRCITEFGNCVNPYDTYNMLLAIVEGEEVVGSINVEFQVKNDSYQHDEKPAKEDCKVVEGEERIYWVYKCTKCDLWIVAYYEDIVD